MNPDISAEDFKKFRDVLHSMEEKDVEIIYNSLDSWTFQVGGFSESQDIDIYDEINSRRNDEVLNVLKKYGLCDFTERYSSGSPIAVLDNFRWTGPLQNTNSSPNNTNIGTNPAQDLKIPIKCTDEICILYGLIQWKKAVIQTDEALQKDLDTKKAFYMNVTLRSKSVSGDVFPTSFNYTSAKIPMMIDEATYEDREKPKLDDPSQLTTRIPLAPWRPPVNIDEKLASATKLRRIEGSISPEQIAECISLFQARQVFDHDITYAGSDPVSSKLKAKQQKLLIKLGLLQGARNFNIIYTGLNAWMKGLPVEQIPKFFPAARAIGQKLIFYGPKSLKGLTPTVGGGGILAAERILAFYGLVTAISEGDVKGAVDSGWGFLQTFLIEYLKHVVKDEVYAGVTRTLAASGTLGQSTIESIALTEATEAANASIVWPIIVGQLILLGGLELYGYAMDEAMYQDYYNEGVKAGYEPYAYASTGGQVIVKGRYFDMTAPSVIKRNNLTFFAPSVWPTSDGGSIPAERYTYGPDPYGLWTDITGKPAHQSFISRFRKIIEEGNLNQVPWKTAYTPSLFLLPVIEVYKKDTPDTEQPGWWKRQWEKIKSGLDYIFSHSQPFPLGTGKSVEPIDMVSDIHGTIGEIEFNPPKLINNTHADIIKDATERGKTLNESDKFLLNPSISYDGMSSMMDTGIESLTSRHRLHGYGNNLYSCLSLVSQMLVDNLSNIPPVDLNQYPSQQTDLIGGDNMSKFIPDLAMIGGNTAPYSEGDFTVTPPGSTCFPGYINVLTPTGDKKISEINVGDVVISFNENTGEILPKTVIHKFIHDGKEKSDVYRYKLSNGSILDITNNHSVFTENGSFKQIGQLNIGDNLVDIDDNLVSIVSKEFLFNDVVYNIEVEDFHTYFAEKIKVHNAIKTNIEYIIGQNENNFITGNTEGMPPEERGSRAKGWYNSGGTPMQQGFTPNSELLSKPKQPKMSYCFPSFSKIFTPNGLVDISSLDIGDLIFSYNFDGKLEESTIVHKIQHMEEPQDVYKYIFSDGSVLNITEDHRVLKSNGQFHPVCDLKIGDSVKNIFNQVVVLLEKEYLDKIPVYSIFPEKNDTYIVDGIRVSSGFLIEVNNEI